MLAQTTRFLSAMAVLCTVGCDASTGAHDASVPAEDLSVAPDFGPRTDMAPPLDMATPLDMTSLPDLALAGSWRWENPLPSGDVLSSVWAGSDHDIWAVGEEGLALHFDGTAWSAFQTPTTRPLGGVWGSGSADVWAIAGPDQILHWDGARWSNFLQVQGLDFEALGGSGPNDVWALGWATAWHWDGRAWSARTFDRRFDGRLIWSAGPDSIWAAGVDTSTSEGVIQRWDGSAWSRVYTVPGVWFTQLIGFSDNDVWASDGSVLIHWDGAAWVNVAMPSQLYPRSLTGRSSQDIWLRGALGAVWRYDGTSFLEVVPGTQSVFGRTAITTAGTKDLWVVGHLRTIEHWDGTALSKVQPLASVTTSDLVSVRGSGADDVWLAGQQILHWDGASLTVTDPDSWAGGMLWSASKSDAWLVRPLTCSQIRRWDGKVWSDMVSPALPAEALDQYGCLRPRDVWGAAANDVWLAVGKGLLHWDGTSWAFTLQNLPLERIWGASAKDVWAGGQNGVVHWDGTSWTPQAAAGFRIQCIGGSSAQDVWFGGTGLTHWSQGKWNSVGGLVNVTAVWSSGPSDAWAIAQEKSSLVPGLWHWDGTTWSLTNGVSLLADVWGTGADDVWAVGVDGRILHYTR